MMSPELHECVARGDAVMKHVLQTGATGTFASVRPIFLIFRGGPDLGPKQPPKLLTRMVH